MSEITRDFTTDTSDRRLLEFDLRGSIAHATMLGETGIIAGEEADELVSGLERILSEGLEFQDDDEDVHSAVERRLGELVGEVAGKLHTGRSRNDQVALDLRLYLLEGARSQLAALQVWIDTLIEVAESYQSQLIPTYTHLQQAQVTSVGNHLLAYAWMAVRDAERFKGCADRLASSPLGAGASAGSTLPIDREATAELLGIGPPMANTLDAVGSRDFAAEYIFCCSQTMIHLSRLAEELILWSSSEFGIVFLGDRVSTGSSALPHKRNPDIAELVRGRASTTVGDVASLLALQKGLPLTYNRDLQEDKKIVFRAHDASLDSLSAISHLLRNIEFEPVSPEAGTMALPLSEKLVRRGVPFREAHEVVGGLILKLEAEGRSLQQATLQELAAHDSRFEEGDLPIDATVPNIAGQVAALRRWREGS